MAHPLGIPVIGIALAAAVVVTASLLAQPASAQEARRDSDAVPHDYTPADVRFMQDMIMHHAQAVVMSDWAATHGAAPSLLILAKRIALSQRDEIALMQHWLLDRHLTAPDPLHMLSGDTGPVHDTSPMQMPGMDMGAHPMMMAGMLTPEEMRQLDSARGTAFDRLYLTGMIKHHEGALAMVAHLYATPGGGQQPELSNLVNDIDAGQRVEIARMQAMLNTLNPRES